MAAKKAAKSYPKLGPPYGVVDKKVVGNATIIVRCIFARRDYFHWRVIGTSNPSLLELVERQRGGLLKQGDTYTLKDAKAEALRWLQSHPKAQIG